MLAKKKNVKSCIIYEICIKEKCNSIINKILIQFLEPVVLLKFLFAVCVDVYEAAFQGLDDILQLPLASNSSSAGHPTR